MSFAPHSALHLDEIPRCGKQLFGSDLNQGHHMVHRYTGMSSATLYHSIFVLHHSCPCLGPLGVETRWADGVYLSAACNRTHNIMHLHCIKLLVKQLIRNAGSVHHAASDLPTNFPASLRSSDQLPLLSLFRSSFPNDFPSTFVIEFSERVIFYLSLGSVHSVPFAHSIPSSG